MNEDNNLNTTESAPETPKPANKRSFRFLVIYILLLFSVSAVFLVTSYFAEQNTDTKHELGKAQSRKGELENMLAETKANRDDYKNKLEDKEKQYRETLDEKNKLQTTVDKQTEDIDDLQSQIETLQKELDILKPSPATSPLPTSTPTPTNPQ